MLLSQMTLLLSVLAIMLVNLLLGSGDTDCRCDDD